MDNALNYVFSYLKLIRVSDFVDIFLTAVVIFYLIKWLQETRAMQLVKGIVILFAVMIISDWINLTVINYVISAVVQVGLFAVVVIFQPELRSLLERMGRSKFGRIIDIATQNDTSSDSGETAVSNHIIDAVTEMASQKTGAIIVMERETKLGDHTSRGIKLDADISKELIENIFFKNSPLHDGAVIVRNGRIHSAGCLLPLTSNTNLSSEIGTRHRAALGWSEVSDAMIIVVSEETGKISIASGGALTRNVSKEPLRHALERFFENDEETFRQLFRFRRGGGKREGK